MWVNLRRRGLLFLLLSVLLSPLFCQDFSEKDKIIAEQAQQITELKQLVTEWLTWYDQLTPDLKSLLELWKQERLSRIALESSLLGKIKNLEQELVYWKCGFFIGAGAFVGFAISCK